MVENFENMTKGAYYMPGHGTKNEAKAVATSHSTIAAFQTVGQ